MKSYLTLISISLLAGMLVTPFCPAQADDDFMEARRLQDLGEILPLEQLLKNIRQQFAGKILAVELEKEDSKIAYEIEILSRDGVVREVYINAHTGKIISVEEDD